MKRHRFRKSVKAFKSHIDSEKEQQLKGIKSEIDDKVKRILKLVKDEDLEEDKLAVDGSKKEPLADLIEDLYKHYESLYAQYDHLTGEIKKDFQDKLDNERSSSSSSDSDSNDLKHKGSKNGKLESVTDGIKQELEMANAEIAQLRKNLTDTTSANEALNLEYQTALSKAQDGEENADFLKIQAQRFDDEVTKLILENGELNRKLDAAGKTGAELCQRLEVTEKERDNLIVEKNKSVKMIEEGEKVLTELKSETDQLKDENAILQQELQTCKEEASNLKQLLESAEHQVSDLSLKLKVSDEENQNLSIKNAEISSETENAQKNIQELVAESNEWREKLEEKERELSALSDIHEVHQKKFSDQVKGLEDQLRGLELELESQRREMGVQIDEVAGEAEKLREENQGLQASISNLETTLQVREDEISVLTKKLQDSQNESSTRIGDMEVQLKDALWDVDALRTEKKEYEEQIANIMAESNELKDKFKQNEGELSALVGTHEADQRKLSAWTEELEERVQGLRLELESAHVKKREMEALIEKEVAEARKLREENEEVQARVSEYEMISKEKDDKLSALTLKLQDSKNESSNTIEDLMAQISNLLQNVDALRLQKKELEERMEQTHKETKSHMSGLTEQVAALKQDLESIGGQKNELILKLENRTLENSGHLILMENMRLEMDGRMVELQRALEEKENLAGQAQALVSEIESLRDQKTKLEEQINSKNNERNQFKDKMEELRAMNAELEKKLAERDAEHSAVMQNLEGEGKEASAQILTLRTQVNSLKEELDSSQTLKNQIQKKVEKNSESLTQIENEKLELTLQVQELQRISNEQEEAYKKLEEAYRQIEVSFEECKGSLQDAEKRMEQMVTEFRKNSGCKDLVVLELEQRIEDLKSDLEIKADEINTLVENARRIEVTLRLSNQKLRVTEQTLAEKEVEFRSAELKYQQDISMLEERVAMLSELLAAHQHMIKGISEEVNGTVAGLESVIKKLMAKSENYDYTISEMSSGLQTVRNWVAEANIEKDRLRGEVNQLAEQLQEKKEQELLLRRQAENLAQKASKVEIEMGKISRVNCQLEKKIEELEKSMRDKERDVLGVEEEKREAIRQLCLSIDYHQSRYDDLMSRISTRNRRTA